MTAPAFDPIHAPLDGLQFVEASAGTGKTWALSALYLRLLLERGLEVPQILVTTFTKAATAELKDRLRQRIAELLRALEPGAEADTFARALLQRLRAPALALPEARIRQRLELALGSFDEAAVYTLHGFCQRALELGAFSAGVPFTREAVADDAEWRRQVVNDFWRRRIAGVALDPGFAIRCPACSASCARGGPASARR
jgi:exodeoxyribonuclease V beta subunit